LPPDTPQVYVHKWCRKETEMPADVIAEYLENPFELGEEPTTICSRCKKEVLWTECHWSETKQDLYEYLDDLRAEMVIAGNDPRSRVPPLNWLTLVFSLGVGIGVGIATGAAIGMSKVLFGAVGAGLGLGVGFIWMVVERNRYTQEFAEWDRQLLKRYYKRHPEAKTKKKRRQRDDE
jgi:hypothetical protein